MKKLIRTLLIATASVGAIAGSTAAVVSCGDSKQSKDLDVVVDKLVANQQRNLGTAGTPGTLTIQGAVTPASLYLKILGLWMYKAIPTDPDSDVVVALKALMTDAIGEDASNDWSVNLSFSTPGTVPTAATPQGQPWTATTKVAFEFVNSKTSAKINVTSTKTITFFYTVFVTP